MRGLSILVVVAIAGCPAPRGANRGGEAAAGFDPYACGNISTNDLGRKLYAFFVATAELDRASSDMEQQIHNACSRMAVQIGVPPGGDTRSVCQAVANELKADIPHDVAAVKYTPAQCTTDVSITAQAAAECEGRAPGDMAVTCEVQSGSECRGYASVDASAECKSSAEVRASLQTHCSDARIEITQSPDDAKLRAAFAALGAGMPALLTIAARGEILAKAVAGWAETAQSLANSSAELIGALGEKSVCVAGQLSALATSVTNIQARFSVAVEVQASFSVVQ